MGNYELLKAAINDVIKANGRQEITGEVLNQVLLSMVNSLGAGYQCMGVATPSTNPGTPDQNVFYFATQAGTYTDFDAIVLQAGISVLIWDGDWASQTWFTVDSAPTNNSQNLIASGAVFNALKLDGGAYDVSAHNSGATFASLSALLNSANLNTLIPTEIRHGGMSIKFVQSSDNKYVQYFCRPNSFTTNIDDWDKMNLEDEVVKNGIATGLLFNITTILNKALNKDNGQITKISGVTSKYTDILPCKEGERYYYKGVSQFIVAGWAFYNNGVFVSYGQYIGETVVTIPSDVNGVRFCSYADGTETPILDVCLLTPITQKLVNNSKFNDKQQNVIPFVSDSNRYKFQRFIKELYYQPIGNNTLCVRNLIYDRNNDKINFALGNANGYVVSGTFEPINDIVQYSNGLYIVFQNIEEITGAFISGNVDTSIGTVNNEYVKNLKYSYTIWYSIYGIDLENIPLYITPIKYTEHNGYLNSDGQFVGGSSIHSLTTHKIPCKENDVFLYKGIGEFSAVSVLYYDENGIIDNSKYKSNVNYTEITIPSGVKYVVFSSYANSDSDVILDVLIKNPVSTQYLEKRIDAITIPDILNGKSVIWDGDSIAAGAGYAGGYGKIIADRNGMTSNNVAVSGGTIAKNQFYYVAWKNDSTIYYTKPFRPIPGTTLAYDSHGEYPSGNSYTIDAYNSENNTITIGGVIYTYSPSDSHARHWVCESVKSLTDVDYYILEGGVNDATNAVPLGELSNGFNAALDEETFYGAFESMIKTIYENHGGKKVGYVFVHKVGNYWQKGQSYFDAAMICCNKWCVPIIDLTLLVPPFAIFPLGTDLYTNLRAVYTKNADGTHPNEQGYKKYYCDKIQSWMKTL